MYLTRSDIINQINSLIDNNPKLTYSDLIVAGEAALILRGIEGIKTRKIKLYMLSETVKDIKMRPLNIVIESGKKYCDEGYLKSGVYFEPSVLGNLIVGHKLESLNEIVEELEYSSDEEFDRLSKNLSLALRHITGGKSHIQIGLVAFAIVSCVGYFFISKLFGG